MVEDRLQDLDSSTCGIFQVFFYESFCNPLETKRNKKTVEILLNEIFTLDDRENEIKMEGYANDLGIEIM